MPIRSTIALACAAALSVSLAALLGGCGGSVTGSDLVKQRRLGCDRQRRLGCDWGQRRQRWADRQRRYRWRRTRVRPDDVSARPVLLQRGLRRVRADRRNVPAGGLRACRRGPAGPLREHHVCAGRKLLLDMRKRRLRGSRRSLPWRRRVRRRLQPPGCAGVRQVQHDAGLPLDRRELRSAWRLLVPGCRLQASLPGHAKLRTGPPAVPAVVLDQTPDSRRPTARSAPRAASRSCPATSRSGTSTTSASAKSLRT